MGSDTKYYCVFLRSWEGQFMEELILTITVIVVRFCRGEYREELILNATAFFCEDLVKANYKGIDTYYYCNCCEVLRWGYRLELILNVRAFFVSVWGWEY
jgi:hypothetical protein